MRTREGDLIKTRENIIFDVKGLVHPPDKVIAFPRFIPDLTGFRKHEGAKYKKIYALSTRFRFLEQKYPQYTAYDAIFDEKLCAVPLEKVEEYYRPAERLHRMRSAKRLDGVEMCALEFLEQLKTCTGISWDAMGISGSLLVKLHSPGSDVDPIVYGTQNCLKAYWALKSLQKDAKSAVKPYSPEELRRLFGFRFQDTRVSFEDFVRTESRKALQGMFKGRDYFMRFVKDWHEVQEEYGDVQYRNLGYAKVKAEVEDDSEVIFTPCSYRLRNVRVLEGANHHAIKEIASFRGRFCEQARRGEVVIAQGKVEKVTDKKRNFEHYRLLIGNKPTDFMVLA